MAGATREIIVNPTSKGLAVIITNDYYLKPNKEPAACSDEKDPQYEPLSTEKDGNRLERAFKFLNYDVCWRHNVKAFDVQRIWNEISNLKYEEVKHYRCIVLVFSGHGEQADRETSPGGKLVMQDHSKVRISEEFIAPLLPGKARSIGKIPKVFLIDACRGGKKTEIVQVPRKSTNSKGKVEASPDPGADSEELKPTRKGGHEILFTIPKEGNFLVSYSTLPGCVSNDIRGDGSAWLKLIADEIPISDKSLEDVLTGLNKKLHAYYREHNCEFQQPEKVSRLNDILHLKHDNDHNHLADGGRHLIPSAVPRPIEPYQPPAHVYTQQSTNQRASEGDISSAPNQPVQSASGPVHSSSNGVGEVVPRAKYKKGTGKYCVHLKRFTNPKFDYITDRSSPSTTRHRCTISYWKDGKKLHAESGYSTSIMMAEEQAVKRILSRENWPPCD